MKKFWGCMIWLTIISFVLFLVFIALVVLGVVASP